MTITDTAPVPATTHDEGQTNEGQGDDDAQRHRPPAELDGVNAPVPVCGWAIRIV